MSLDDQGGLPPPRPPGPNMRISRDRTRTDSKRCSPLAGARHVACHGTTHLPTTSPARHTTTCSPARNRSPRARHDSPKKAEKAQEGEQGKFKVRFCRCYRCRVDGRGVAMLSSCIRHSPFAVQPKLLSRQSPTFHASAVSSFHLSNSASGMTTNTATRQRPSRV